MQFNNNKEQFIIYIRIIILQKWPENYNYNVSSFISTLTKLFYRNYIRIYNEDYCITYYIYVFYPGVLKMANKGLFIKIKFLFLNKIFLVHIFNTTIFSSIIKIYYSLKISKNFN